VSYNVSKIKLKKFSIFSLGSRKFGYGHYNRSKNLISILKTKGKKFTHYSLGKNYKNKNKFIKQLKLDYETDNNIIIDLTNNLFLNEKTILKLQTIFKKQNNNKVYIIDSPTKKNLSSILKLDFIKTLIPFDVSNQIRNDLLKINNKKIGFDYFIYSNKSLKEKKKIYDITVSFGASDKYQGSLYVLKLLKNLELNKKILVVIGQYFNNNYMKKVVEFSNKNKFKTIFFSKNFSDILDRTKLLITNSGLTKYEGYMHGIPILIFSDNNESKKIDEVFVKKTRQINFSYLKDIQNDTLKLKKIINKKLNVKFNEYKYLKPNVNKIRNFFDK
jgi:spore coat polysaccharide biosynthesis predicted glycosyltransferase SpsG